MRKDRTWSAGMALGLIGLLGAFAGCSGSVETNGGGCESSGKHYAQGERFPAGDGCNTCSCDERGGIQCTLVYCGPIDQGCTTADGKTYLVGQQVSNDGCNTCTCMASGDVACTARDCPSPGVSCADRLSELKSTLASVQKCDSAADCGQRIPESSCGCTRDLIARNDADLSSYLAQRSKVRELACETEGGSTCDCPNADGFACIDHVCGWNYVSVEPEPTCAHVDAAELCVRGTKSGDGEVLRAGDPLQVTVQSGGCLSSSCSKVVEASCTIGSSPGFEVEANFCVANTAAPGTACTADCGVAHADCSFGQPLTAGEHQVNLGSITVGFQVPTVLPRGGLCARAR